MIPDEMKCLRHWIELPPGQKRPTGADWQKRPHPWDDIKEPHGRGFLLLGTPYLCIDGDHVLKGGAYVCQWAEDFFRAMLATGTYAERSLSKTGVHVFFKVEPGKTYEGHINELKGMGAKGGRYFDYAIPGFEHLPKNERPHVEIFYNAVQQICLTGDSIGGDTIEHAPAVLNRILEKMPAFSVPRAGDAVPPPAAPVERKTELLQEYDLQRAARMLDYIDPATVDYADWLKAGMVLHDLGADFSLWDAWSQKDAARYKGVRETAGKWRSFRRGSGATIAGLHALAKSGGYDEKTFAREWHRTHPPDPKAEFEDLDAAPPPAAPVERKEAARDLWDAGMVQEFLEHVEAGQYIPEPTGIPVFDGFFYGGLMRGQLVLLGAAPGMGKTATLQWLVETMADRNDGFSCMYFCFEMSRDQLIARGLSRWMYEQGHDFPAICIMKGDGMDDVKATARTYARIAARVSYNPGAGALARPKLSALLETMTAGARYRNARGEKIPFVVVDYVQLVDAGGKDEMENIQNTMNALKTFAVNWNTVVLAAMATNRQSNKAGDSSMFSGRGSSALEYGADVVLTLAYTDVIEGEKEPRDRKRRSIVVSKGRGYGERARLDFQFDGRHSSLHDLHAEFDDSKGGRILFDDIEELLC